MIPLELSRPVSAERPPAAFTVTATPEECGAIGLRLNIPCVEALVCRFTLRTQGQAVLATGRLDAQVVQECIVTLEPLRQAVEEDFVVRFVPEGEETQDDDPDSPDELTYVGGRIDLGEAAVEQLALALDPYPRSVPSPDMQDCSEDDGPNENAPSPGKLPGGH